MINKRVQVRVADQELLLWEDDQVVARYPVSTSKFGLGTEEGSFKTPLGRFRIAECFGEGAPEGTIFRSRQVVGLWQAEPVGVLGVHAEREDLVLSRILWLEGLEEENANSKERYIYIHGTNHEGDIGKPASMGCVRMRNRDVIALYDQVEPGVEVEVIG